MAPTSVPAVWVRSAAIRPVPGHAQLDEWALTAVEEWLGSDESVTELRLRDLFERFEAEQPILAAHVGGALARMRDEISVALGYFLSLVVWLAFENSFGPDLQRVDEIGLESVEQALALDEELRGQDPGEALDSDDVIAMEQPFVMPFIQEHVEAAIEVHAEEVDVDTVEAVYRLIMVELLALSYAVRAPDGYAIAGSEVHA